MQGIKKSLLLCGLLTLSFTGNAENKQHIFPDCSTQQFDSYLKIETDLVQNMESATLPSEEQKKYIDALANKNAKIKKICFLLKK